MTGEGHRLGADRAKALHFYWLVKFHNHRCGLPRGAHFSAVCCQPTGCSHVAPTLGMKNTSVNRQNTGTVAMLWRGGNWVTGRWQDGWRERKVAKQRIVAKMSGNDPPPTGVGGWGTKGTQRVPERLREGGRCVWTSQQKM